MPTRIPVVIIGAGPYGLSLSAHLHAKGVEHRIFGRSMSTWMEHMPSGMYLKSEGFASNLSDPKNEMTLRAYCHDHGLSYADMYDPVNVKTYVEYGRYFAERLVPNLEQLEVVNVSKSGAGLFDLALSDGTTAQAEHVVLAIGVAYFSYIPETLRELGPEHVSHSSNHHDLSAFAGQDVCVIGAGQSALETAALLHESGASVQVLARRHSVDWNSAPPEQLPSLAERFRHPLTPLGRGVRNFAYANAPGAFRHLPPQKRFEIVAQALGPAGAWWLKKRVIGRIPIVVGQEVREARTEADRARLIMASQDGVRTDLLTSHVIAATGYRVDVSRLTFMAAPLRKRTRSLNGSPVLTRHFESSVPGLYFVGLAASHTFGPVQRFVCGAPYASRVVAKHITSQVTPNRVSPRVPQKKCA